MVALAGPRTLSLQVTLVRVPGMRVEKAAMLKKSGEYIVFVFVEREKISSNGYFKCRNWMLNDCSLVGVALS